MRFYMYVVLVFVLLAASPATTRTPFKISLLPKKNMTLEQSVSPPYASDPVPASYDFRTEFPACSGPPASAGQCAASWALIPASVLTDRSCRKTGKRVPWSGGKVLSCCGSCGSQCFGGYPSEAYKFIAKRGVPSEACYPLRVTKTLSDSLRSRASPCRFMKLCFDPKINSTSHFGSLPYKVKNVQREILERGPVSAEIDVYSNLFDYTTGVYVPKGYFQGTAAVKVRGWGKQNNTEYWILDTVWGPAWGNNGTLWAPRGKGDLGVEATAIAANVNS